MRTTLPAPSDSRSPGESLELDGPILDERERKGVLSGLRLKLTLIALIVLIIAGLATMVFVMVTNIFDSLTPAVRRDLLWKAERGVAELSRTTELGIAAEDPENIEEACAHFVRDQDVLALMVIDTHGQVLFLHGELPMPASALFARRPGVAHPSEGHFATWAPAEIEGVPIGKVALVVSTDRLQAGLQLRSNILAAGLGGALFALLAALAFVNLYIGPLLRMTERAFHQLERTTELALESARLKSQFLANMSHEIRTPMNGVLGMTRLILDMPLDGKLRRYVETVEASGRALLTIINDILDFSKIEAGKYKIQSIEFDLRLVTQEVAELLAERAQAKKLELVYRVAPEVPSRIVGDPDRFRQVITNLIGNAIKFTEQGEVFVEVSTKREHERAWLWVHVTDTGIGIAKDACNTVFEAFSQEDGSTARSHGGTGLGLAISKRMVEMMGGEIGVASEPGSGSCFEFTLPLAVAAQQPPPLAPIEPTGRRALLVDANAHARGIVEEHLKAWGMGCSAHASGRAALEALKDGASDERPFDVALIANRTQDISGEALLMAIKAEPTLTGTPIVLLNQLGASSTPSELSDAVVSMLSKPIRLSELYDCLVGTFTGEVRRRVTGSDEPTREVTGLKVLIVDDNEINQFVAAEQIEQFGYEVELASNGAEAVEAVARGGFAAVLMDCQMPVMDGYDATREIRRREAGTGERLPIIALTAHALMGERDKVLEAGMDDYLTKPIRADALRKVLARLVRDVTPPAAAAPSSHPPSAPPRTSQLDPETRRSPKVTQLFLEHIPQQLAALRTATMAGDHDATRAQAHKLKGSCASFGAWRMAPVAEGLQHATDAELAEAVERVDQLEELFERVVLELNPPRPSHMPSGPAPAASEPPLAP